MTGLLAAMTFCRNALKLVFVLIFVLPVMRCNSALVEGRPNFLTLIFRVFASLNKNPSRSGLKTTNILFFVLYTII